MKLLISAYACAPNRGSEHGVGWNWATEAHRQGHDVWVMASSSHRDLIAATVRKHPDLAGIRWLFPEIGFWPLRQGIEPKWERTYNFFWQKAALRAAFDLQRTVGFDAVHHLTWGGLRAPTFLGSLGVPLIVGPTGGGETSPRLLRDRLRIKGRVLEKLRDLSNATIEINPLVGPGLRQAAIIFAKTEDTRNAFSPRLRDKTAVLMELVVSEQQIGSPRPRRQSGAKLLYAGRLLYWKGVHIAVATMASLVTRLPDAHLTIVGSGSEERRLKADVARAGLGAHVTFIPHVPQAELFRLYDSHDLLLFPSLHDSTGGVVLEALCRAMPVACLDLGGPKNIVTPQCGIIARTAGLDTAGLARQLADSLHEALTCPATMERLSAGAIARARDFLMSRRVTQLYATVQRAIEGHGIDIHPRADLMDDAPDRLPRSEAAPAPPRHLVSEDQGSVSVR